MEREMKLVARFLCCIALAPVAWAADPHAGRPPFSDVEYWTTVFDDPARHEWQRPGEVMRLLALEHGDVVADIGAGTGYFTQPLSWSVGETGKVYAVDVERKMLDHIKTREDIVQDVVETVLATRSDPKLPANMLDVIMIVDTWHHIDGRRAYLDKLRTALRPSGRLVIIDYIEGELPVGPPPEHKLGRDQVVRELEGADWTLAAESFVLPYQYFLIFHPPQKGVARPKFLDAATR
jgi:SAM-dependent methyltransferase